MEQIISLSLPMHYRVSVNQGCVWKIIGAHQKSHTLKFWGLRAHSPNERASFHNLGRNVHFMSSVVLDTHIQVFELYVRIETRNVEFHFFRQNCIGFWIFHKL